MVSTFSISTDPGLTLLSSSVAQAEPPCSRKVPLYICLGDRLCDATEIACTRAVAGYLSGLLGRVVDLAELEGLSLYLWSEDDIEGRVLADYRNGESPLQGLLLETRQRPSEGLLLANAELLRFVGVRFEFAVAGSDLDASALLRKPPTKNFGY